MLELSQRPEDLLREFMLRELGLSVWLHQIRGALTGAWGWLELSELRGQPLPAGLRAGMQGIKESLAIRPSPLGWPRLETELNTLRVLLSPQELDRLSRLHPAFTHSLDAALEWASPSSALLAEDKELSLTLSGLSPWACQRLFNLSPSLLTETRGAPESERRLGVFLLQALQKGHPCRLEIEEEGRVRIYLPAER